MMKITDPGLLDPWMVPHLETLNAIGGVETLQSCSGHEFGEWRAASGETGEVDGVLWFRATRLFRDSRLELLSAVRGVDAVAKLYGREDFPVVEVLFRRVERDRVLRILTGLLRFWALVDQQVAPPP